LNRTPLRRRSRLRPLSPKRRAGLPDWNAVYAEVDARSDGRCELAICSRRASEHHHCRKPRASHHTAALVLHLCRDHHRMAEAPYRAGRLVTRPTALGIGWAIVRQRDKWAQEAELLAAGLVAFS
jgi:hypothetical protein